MQNGIYLAQFVVGTDHSNGVVVVRDGQARGGDNAYWLDGTLSESGDDFSGELKMTKHSGAAESIFGFFDNFAWPLTGKRKGDAWQSEGPAPVRTAQLNLRLLKAD